MKALRGIATGFRVVGLLARATLNAIYSHIGGLLCLAAMAAECFGAVVLFGFAFCADSITDWTLPVVSVCCVVGGAIIRHDVMNYVQFRHECKHRETNKKRRGRNGVAIY